ncbi:hypothetical protein VPDG_00075 [Vibrio phage henriette 12B8]|uniref:hypothetical protein n=1 Tax=Vibrio phage henriette 12B8 TaxID=573174 RepID=UPI0002C0A9CC|nr:hypothetical protein VPDG_00075 [Vibrio phage henriette 12B8]AGG58236.1 hypothetical protein VPDG_00075 [Vibrio phage henriette 12B8]
MYYFDERAKRKSIAKAVTDQCGIDGEVGYNDITIVDQTLGMETIDVEFTINGKDGDVFCAKLETVTFCGFGKRYDVVGMVRLKEPKPNLYDHKVYAVIGGNGNQYAYKNLSISQVKMTREEWLDELFDNGLLNQKITPFPPLTVVYRHNGNPIFDNEMAVKRLVANLNFYSAITTNRPKIMIHNIWGITPISKKPALLNMIAATSFKGATRKLHDTSGYGTTVVHGEVHYNDRPVFPTQEAAKNWLALDSFSNAAISAGNLMAEISKTVAANAKKKSDDALNRTRPDTKTYSIWGVGEDKKPTKLGDEHATTFDKAKHQFWQRWNIRDNNGYQKYVLLVGLDCQRSLTYLGHPVFESESEAQAYIYAEVKPVKPTPRKVTELPCFKSVSDVIGKQSAMCALFKVLNTPDCHLDLDNPHINGAFEWLKTPQGISYWFVVSASIQTKMEEERK